MARQKDNPGMVTALALTPSGAITARVECLLLSGRGRLILTGNLKGEAKDSGQVALSLAISRAKRLGIDPAEFQRTDVHFHIPGAPTKDGPSAGLAMLVALVSAMTRKPVDPGIAFTGELSLSGKILGVGGISEKVIAALQGGVTSVYAPTESISEMKKLPKKSQKGFKMIPADSIDSVLDLLFGKPKKSPSSR